MSLLDYLRTDSQKQAKVIAIILFLFISLFIYVNWTIYPLTLTLTEGYLIQIPVYYWILLSGTLLGSLGIVLVRPTPSISLISAVIFFLISSSYQFLFRGLFGGDYTISNYEILHRDATFSADLHFSYFQFSQSWILHRVQYLTSFAEYDTLTTIEFGFFLYIILFAIAVWSFAYLSLRNSLYAFIAAAVFFVTVRWFLNFQYVPQFFALILLLFLLAVHHKSGHAWTGIKLLLFVALVLSHPMFFVFYLAALLFYPIISGIFAGLGGDSIAQNRPLIATILARLRTPTVFIKQMMNATIRILSNQSWQRYAVSGVAIYLLFYFFRFYHWQQSMMRSLFIVDHRGHTAQFLGWFGLDIGYDLEEVDAALEATTQPLYHLSSVEISSITTTGTMIFVIVAGLLLAVTSLLRPIREFRPFNIAVFVVGFSYFIAGLALNILGTRALQVIFIPFILSLTVLDRRRTVGLLVIVLLLTASPVLAANALNNAALAGGHSTGDYYTEEAGQFLEEYDYDTVIQARTTQYPVDVTNEREHIWIRDLLHIPGQEHHVAEPGDYIQFDYRLYHDVDRHLHQCTFDQQHVIFDNTNQIMLVGETPFECNPYE